MHTNFNKISFIKIYIYKILRDYMEEKSSYKLMLIAPIALLVASLFGLVLLMQSGIQRDIDLKGGMQISFDSAEPVDAKAIEDLIGKDARVRIAKGFTGYSVLIDAESEKGIIDVLKENGYAPTIRTVSPALSAVFFRQAVVALVIAFVFMAFVVFAIFRKPLPSMYVVFAAFSDILEAFVISQFLGIKLSLASFAALLLLIGYSVDTDILLTSRVLKGEGGKTKEEIKEKTKGAMKTGLMMTATTLSAVMILLLISTSDVLTQIASILLIGLTADIINTWMGNAVLLRWYLEKK